MLIFPTVTRPQWSTQQNPALTANDPTFNGYCIVNALPALTLTGQYYRLTLTPPTSGANLVLASVWLGLLASAPSWDGNQVQATFSGSNGVTLTAGGSDVVSDTIHHTGLTTAGVPAVALGVTSGDFRRNNAIATYTIYFKSADAANAGTTAKAGYSTTATSVFGVSRLEVLR